MMKWEPNRYDAHAATSRDQTLCRPIRRGRVTADLNRDRGSEWYDGEVNGDGRGRWGWSGYVRQNEGRYTVDLVNCESVATSRMEKSARQRAS
jgi:hypothetical protein